MKLSRPCYDKYWRCPGWAGGGPHRAKHTRCDGGSLIIDWQDKWWKWKLHRCGKCGILVLPYHAKKLSLFDLWENLRWRFR